MGKKFLHQETIAVHDAQKAYGSQKFPVPPLILNSAVLLDSGSSQEFEIGLRSWEFPETMI